MTEIPVWMPTRVERHEKLVERTSTRPSIVATDAGPAYIKCLGNPEGPHALARELVGTRLAKWFGLATFDVAIVDHDGIVDIPVGDGQLAESGPAFVAKAEEGRTWSGDVSELEAVVNPAAFTRIVVFDTWVRNHDRHCLDPTRLNYDNVFFSTTGLDGEAVRLLAIDHTHAFTKGSDLSTRMNRITDVKDEVLYGLYPEFQNRLSRDVLAAAIGQLQQATRPYVCEVMEEVPPAWEVADNVKSAWADMLVMRAEFLVDRIEGLLAPYLPEKKLF